MISADEAGRNFDRLLAQVEAGQSLTITRDGRPVAVVTPVADETANDRDILRQKMMEMMRKGIPIDYQGPLDREALHRR
ncbi:MAG: type II toxin-antitoxin system prevent-host-death family antitoxin [Niveispirillum sp.]|nr:type II toxin-antitoxin system prevent-host-death family antitoxin [Niveispirillum sp.]